jgi:hypothetical protein
VFIHHRILVERDGEKEVGVQMKHFRIQGQSASMKR